MMQVCNHFSLYARKTDDRCTLLFPCPQVLRETLSECFFMALLLLCCGDIESNLGPTTRSEALLDIKSLLDNPIEQMGVLFRLLRDVHAGSLQSSKFQAEVVADIKSIKTGQKTIETNVLNIQQRLNALEEISCAVDGLGVQISELQSTAGSLATQYALLQSRIDELEDRSRRDILLFYGSPDSKETWQQTETKLTTILNEVIPSLPSGSIERAHRIGSLSPNKCRPVITKFVNFKVKEQKLLARKLFKQKNNALSEDFCPATRIAQKKLTEFAKNQPGFPPFFLSHNKLIINEKCYMYNANTDRIEDFKSNENPVLRQPVTASAPVLHIAA
uniref:Putative tick transposon ovary overexpressed n=1 Tax=Rhipicephalus microplus TaxID=6941 RepID=A0A6M2D8T2_RHIMP